MMFFTKKTSLTFSIRFGVTYKLCTISFGIFNFVLEGHLVAEKWRGSFYQKFGFKNVNNFARYSKRWSVNCWKCKRSSRNQSFCLKASFFLPIVWPQGQKHDTQNQVRRCKCSLRKQKMTYGQTDQGNNNIPIRKCGYYKLCECIVNKCV